MILMTAIFERQKKNHTTGGGWGCVCVLVVGAWGGGGGGVCHHVELHIIHTYGELHQTTTR